MDFEDGVPIGYRIESRFVTNGTPAPSRSVTLRSHGAPDVMTLASAPLWNGRQLAGNWDVIWYYTLQHARYTVFAVSLGFVFALPAAYLAVRHRSTYPVLLTLTNVIYAIPALTCSSSCRRGWATSTTSRSSSPWPCTRS